MIDPNRIALCGVCRKEKTLLPQDRAPTRILIIPHQPNRNVKVRAIELARHLSAQSEVEVYVLVWRVRGRHYPNLLNKLGFKLHEAYESATLQPKIRLEDGIRWVSIPHMLAPYPVNQWFNRRQVEKFIQLQGIQAVISGNAYHFPMPETADCARIYDVVDDHITPQSNAHWQRTREFTLKELKKADQILTISHALQAELEKLGYTNSTLIPNGVDLAAFSPEMALSVAAIQERYEIQQRFTIGYIGNHGWWAGMDLLVDAFKQLHARLPESRLLIVGPGEEIGRYQRQESDRPEIIFTGAIPPVEIAAYFKACSIGVLPFTPCPFTDNAMPLKILEYGAAYKRVLATPLKELQTLQFPHVQLIEPDVERWAEALIDEALNPTPWNACWDDTIARYDWTRLWAPLDTILATHFSTQTAQVATQGRPGVPPDASAL